jgi:hypothetical protein
MAYGCLHHARSHVVSHSHSHPQVLQWNITQNSNENKFNMFTKIDICLIVSWVNILTYDEIIESVALYA